MRQSNPLTQKHESACQRDSATKPIHPDLWVDYAAQVHRWLRPGGSLFALFVQAQRPGAAEGLIQGPPYHCDIHGMRALFPVPRWAWPKPPYPRLSHPAGMAELAVELVRA